MCPRNHPLPAQLYRCFDVQSDQPKALHRFLHQLLRWCRSIGDTCFQQGIERTGAAFAWHCPNEAYSQTTPSLSRSSMYSYAG